MDERRRPGRPKVGQSAVGSAELVVRACDFLKRRSFGDLSWAALGQESGVSGKLFAYYFKTKDGLLTAVLGHLMRTLHHRQEAVTSRKGAPASERLRQRIEVLVAFYLEYPFFLPLIGLLDRAKTAEAQDVLTDRTQYDLETFRKLVLDGERDEAWRHVDLAFFFTTLIAACGYYSDRPAALRLALGRPVTPQDDMRFAGFLTDLLLRGLLAEPGSAA